MPKTAKHLEVQARYIYNPEFKVCPHCHEPLQARPYYQWRKTVQHLDRVVWVASQARECVNPQCEHQGQPYTSATAQMVTVPECTYGLSLFGQLRCHQRRISGRKSTRELRDFGQYQVLFLAESEDDLLQQIRQVPLTTYQAGRIRLAQAEAPRQFLHRLHRDPLGTVQRLVNQHAARRAALASGIGPLPSESDG
jgi:hypothetical protein